MRVDGVRSGNLGDASDELGDVTETLDEVNQALETLGNRSALDCS